MKAYNLVIWITVLIVITMTASAINVGDGDISDWGTNLGNLYDANKWNLEGSWVPKAGVYFVVENDNSTCQNSYYTSPGIHIKGAGSSYTSWTEQSPTGSCQPIGGEPWDVEALYVTDDNNNQNISILAIVSIGPEGWNTTAGKLYICDIAIDPDNDGTYEYGVIIHPRPGLQQWGVYEVASWSPDFQGHSQFCYLTPSKNDPEGVAKGDYFELIDGLNPVKDPVNPAPGKDSIPNWAVEVTFYKSFVGMQGFSISQGSNNHGSKYYLSEAYCGNDAITNEVPEFPLLLIPAGIIVGFFYYHQRKKK